MGRRSASQSVAHFLCELLIRLTVVGRADTHSYDMPLTQEQIADALGLTGVHINRTLQSLRSMELVTVQQRRVTIHDWAALSAFCEFQPDYLYLETVAEAFASELPVTGARGRHRLAKASRSTLRPAFTSLPVQL